MVTNGFYPLHLVSRKREFDEVYTFQFASEEPIAFVPGQYVHLLAPQSPPGPGNVRHLSIASLPEEGTLQFSFDLGSASEYKRKFASLAVGGKAHLFKVKGEFVLPAPLPPRVVFLAGGLGITPARSLLRQIVQRQLPVAWKLAHVARGPFLYEAELASLGGTQQRLRHDEVAPLLDEWAPDRGALWYVSGSHRFVAGMLDELARRGVDSAVLRTEDFS